MKLTNFIMNERSLRALAAKWFLAGFRLSGRGWHGEIYNDEKYPAIKELLLAEFGRLWDAR